LNEKTVSAVSSFKTKEKDLVIIKQTQSQTVCPESPMEIEVVAAGDGVQYQWYKDEVAIESARSQKLSFEESNRATRHGIPAKCIPRATVTQ
jgi:hypothetical protein